MLSASGGCDGSNPVFRVRAPRKPAETADVDRRRVGFDNAFRASKYLGAA